MAKYEAYSVVDFSGGLNNKVDTNLIQDNMCTDVQNCIAPTVGQLQQRKGQARLNSSALPGTIQGLHAYYYGEDLEYRRLVVVSGGVVKSWDADKDVFTNIKTGLSATAPVMFETCVNYMVGMNGINAPWKWDGQTCSGLAGAPVTGKCPVLHAEKLFCITDKETVRWSNSFAPEDWEESNVWMFDKGDGDELSALFSFNRGRELLACKKRSIYRLIGTDMSNFRANKIDSLHGVAGPRAGITVDPYFYYISADGIFCWDGMESKDLTSTTIPQTWALVNKQCLEGAVATYIDNMVWFCVPEGNSTTNNLILVFNLDYKSWWVFRGIEPSCFIRFNDGTTIKTYSGHATSGYVVQQDAGHTDMGSAIESYWVGKNFDGGDPVRIKKFKKAFAVDTAELNKIVFSYRLDGGPYKTPSAITDIKNVRKYGIPNGKGRYFQPKFTHTAANGDFCLSGFELLFRLKKQK